MIAEEVLAELDGVIASVSPAERGALVIQLSARLAALGAGLAEAGSTEHGETDRNLDVQQAAERLGMSVAWIYRNKAKLPCIGLGRRVLFSSRGLDKHLQRRGRRR